MSTLLRNGSQYLWIPSQIDQHMTLTGMHICATYLRLWKLVFKPQPNTSITMSHISYCLATFSMLTHLKNHSSQLSRQWSVLQHLKRCCRLHARYTIEGRASLRPTIRCTPYYQTCLCHDSYINQRSPAAPRCRSQHMCSRRTQLNHARTNILL